MVKGDNKREVGRKEGRKEKKGPEIQAK